MSIISNTLLALSMSADAFAAAISKGVALPKPKLLNEVSFAKNDFLICEVQEKQLSTPKGT